MSRFLTAFAALATMAAAPAFASEDKPAAEKDPMQQRVCIAPHHTTGTLFAKPTCMTRAQWIAKTGVDPVQKK